MGLWESLNERSGRSAGSVDEITNTIAQVRKQRQVEENTKRLRALMMGGDQRSAVSGQPSVISDQMPTNAHTPLVPSQEGTVNSTTPEMPGTSMQPVNIPATSVPNVAESLQRAQRAVPLQNNIGEGNNGMRGLQDMSADEILSMGDILRQTPELSPQVEMLQRAVAARRPKRTFMNQERGALDVITEDPQGGYSVKREVEPWQDAIKPEKKEMGNYIRGGKFVHDVFQEGDQPYEKASADKQQWIKRNGSLIFDVPAEGDVPYEKAQREPEPNPETIRHNKETEKQTRERETNDLKIKDQSRVTVLTDKNKDLTTQMLLMQQDKDAKGNPKYAPETIEQVKKNIQNNQDEIARLHMKNNGKYVTLRVAREYYKGLDPNAPELKLDDAKLQSALEKAGYQVGN